MRLPRARALVTALLAAVLLSLPALVAPPASAHPFGDPQTVTVEARGDDAVRVRWQVGGADDLTLLAVSLGLLPEDRVMLDGAVFPEAGDAEVLAAAPAFAEYVLERITVSADGSPCRGEVGPVTGLADVGVVVDFRCPQRPEAADVTVRMLTDLHPAYRALASGPEGQREVYDVEHDTHRWVLDADADVSAGGAVAAEQDLGRSAALQMGGVVALGGAAAIGVLGAVAWVRRHGRRA